MSAPVFSYAQAAKGLAPSSQPTSNFTSSASSEQGIKESTDSLIPQTTSKQGFEKADSANDIKTERLESSKADTSASDVNRDVATASTKQNIEEHQQSANHVEESITAGNPNPDSRTDESVMIDSPEPSSQNLGEDASSNKTQTSSDREKNRDTDDDWDKVSIPSVAAEKEKDFKAAPLPMVNIWQQRREAQAAKLREVSSQRPTVDNNSNKSKTVSQSNEDSKKKLTGKEVRNSDNTNISSRKTQSGGRTNSREQQSSPGGLKNASSQAETSTSAPPPSVGDVESWPTPETVNVDDRRRSTTQEKLEKVEITENKAGNQKNKWTTLPFVPSVKFETQLPPSAQSRRGGRASNRGRGGFTGTQNERNTEKAESGSMGPPPLPKQTPEQDRGRKTNTGKPLRASSVPTETVRTEDLERTVSRSTATTSKGRESLPNTTQGATTSVKQSNQSSDVSRSPSRKANHQSQTPKKEDYETGDEVSNSPVAAMTPQEQSSQPRSDRFKASGSELHRNHSDQERSDRSGWSKDRAGIQREKSDSWRERGNGRGERGRGTGYRGRGGHSSATGNNPSAHPFTAPLPQHGFETSKSNPSTEPRSRQSSQPFGTIPSFNPSRPNPRSQSIPVSMIQNGYYAPISAFPQALSPIQTDMNYGPYGHVSSGILSAMPYQDTLGSYALMSMVITQLEYYFSLDNLCKDLFLRKNMDSQGFVPLRVIADFRRIKALLGDGQIGYEQLRTVCQQSRTIELVSCEDGEDRLRSRENWKDFILPMEERLPTAQNDGPNLQSHSTVQLPVNQNDHIASPGTIRSPGSHMNGFHDTMAQQISPPAFAPTNFENQGFEQYSSRAEPAQVEPDQRSATTSPLSKVHSPIHELGRVLSGGMVNGHQKTGSLSSEKENTFPDESVAALKVVVKDPEYEGEPAKTSSPDSNATRVSGLRGGAGNFEQLERIRNLQFGQTVPQSRNLSEQTVYWTQGEGSIRPGYVHEEYLSLRDKAQAQRTEGYFDGALLVLYPLWAEFLPLPNQFNVSMYETFKSWALEDQKNGSDNGKKYLIRFYETMLSSKVPMTERIATDIVNVAREESGNDRQVWQRLRSAWRNGATNLKTRKRLTDLLSLDEQKELDRGV